MANRICGNPLGSMFFVFIMLIALVFSASGGAFGVDLDTLEPTEVGLGITG